MIFGLIVLFMIGSIIALIVGVVKKNRKMVVISLISFIVFLMFGVAVFMALGAM